MNAHPRPDEAHTDVAAQQIAAEQVVINGLYQRLDEVLADVDIRLAAERKAPITGTPASHSEREAMVAMLEDRSASLRSVNERLCFGRLDSADGNKRYIGRTGLSDEAANPLLMDWRADAAAPFYQATAAQPLGIARRRHLATEGRVVVGIDDDVLMLAALGDEARESVTGNDSLLTSLDAARTGHMRDIVSTIQAEQDAIIRSELRGILVVQGGPGTGKTVVALHRVAYLLYAHRDKIARSGALIIGPSPRFMSYIDRVLPALGETGVVMQSLGQLFPGVDAVAVDDPAVSAIKGNLRMTEVIRRAVRLRQRVPSKPIPLDIDGTMIELKPHDVAAAIRRARDTRKPHNRARVVFVREIIARLADQLARKLRMNIDNDVRQDLIADLRESRDVRREVNLCWMPVTAERLVADLLGSRDALRAAASDLTDTQIDVLLRPAGSPWTTNDVPLLDEAAELLGEWDPHEATIAATKARANAAEVAYAREVLASSGAAAKMITAEKFAERFSQTEQRAPLAERAAADREWAYGHLVVDEAQELTAMQWRMVMRRCPARSMTLVGDPDQTAAAGGVGSWRDALAPFVQDRWRIARLTINYRTPARIMTSAAAVLTAAGIEANPPESVRAGDRDPQYVQLPELSTAAVTEVIDAQRQRLVHGTVAIIAAEVDRDVANSAVRRAAQALAGGAPTVSVFTPAEAKGLEFDGVIVLEPSTICAEAARAPQDLYVAMTRPTRDLVIAHDEGLPEFVERARQIANEVDISRS